MRACRLKKKYKKKLSAKLLEEYEQTQIFKTKLISNKKFKANRKYCQKAFECSRSIWNICNTSWLLSIRYIYLLLLKWLIDTMTVDSKEKIEILKKIFFSKLPNARLDNIENLTYQETLETPAIIDQGIITANSKSGSDKSSWSNEMPNRVLKYIEQLINLYFNQIFNSNLYLVYYPRHF